MTASFNENDPIGVFDSGLGGLTVVKELMQQLPNERIIYFGDTARVPYGTKSRESVIRFSKQNAQILADAGVKMIVVACNTSSSWALPVLKRSFKMPILGVIEPGAKKAAETTQNNKVGIVATQSTVSSGKYHKAIIAQNSQIKVFAKACPLFVPLAEEGRVEGSIPKAIAKEYLMELQLKDVDTIILGCTHYPLLKLVIAQVMGKNVTLIDSAHVVAQEVKCILSRKGLLRTSLSKPKHQFLVSDEPKHFQLLAKRFLGKNIGSVKRLKF